MSTEFILLASLFLAIPITAKTVTSLQIRELMDGLKRRERDIDVMYSRLGGLEQEREVVINAIVQIDEQRRWSQTRRDLMAEELDRTRRRARTRRVMPVVDESFEPETPPIWEPPEGVDVTSAATAEATA